MTQRRGKISPCTLEVAPWRCRASVGFKDYSRLLQRPGWKKAVSSKIGLHLLATEHMKAADKAVPHVSVLVKKNGTYLKYHPPGYL